MLLIDTYNVLHVTGVLPPELAGLEPSGLAELIARSRYRSREVRLVCDGVKPGAVPGENTGFAGTEAALEPRRQATDRLRGKAGKKGAKGGSRGPSGGPSGPSGPSGASGRGGPRSGGMVAGCEIVYAGPGREADDEIERVLSAYSAARRVLVVSSDRRLKVAAGRAGGAWLDSPKFLTQLVHDAKSGVAGRRAGARPGRPAFAEEVPLDVQSVHRWLGEFGPGAQALIEAAGQERAAQAARVRAAGPRPGSAKQVPAEPTPAPARKSSPKKTGHGLPSGQSPAPVDEALARLLAEEWRGAVSPDDLEMQRWLDGFDQPGR